MSLTQINKAGLDEIALDHVFTVGASGTDHYTFQGEGLNGTVNDPTLYLTRGKTYRFEKGSAHPLRIQSTQGASGTAYNTGVTNNGGTGTVIVEVQHDAPDVLYYQCTSHPNMNGVLYITGALADGGVTTAKIADGSVTQGKLANNAVTTNKIAVDAINNSHISNNSVNTAEIYDEAITLAKLEHGTSSNDGKFLRANNGADPTFETVSTDLVADTSPQLGGSLDCQTHNILLGDSSNVYTARLKVGASEDLQIYHDGSDSYIVDSGTGDLMIRSTDDLKLQNADGSESYLHCNTGGDVILYRAGSEKLRTKDYGALVTGTLSAGSGNFDVTDNGKFKAGNNNDLQIFHDGSNSKIINSQGRLHFENSGGNIRTQTNHGFFIMSADGNTTHAEIDNEGLKFNGDTAGDNALDDYEEGTWNCAFQTNSGSFPSQTAVGRYTKIGRTVHIQGEVFWGASNGSGGGLLYMTLPFTNTSATRGGIAVGLQSGLDFDTDHQLYLMPEVNSTNMYWMQSKSNDPAGGHSHLSPSSLRNYASRAISFAGTYMV